MTTESFSSLPAPRKKINKQTKTTQEKHFFPTLVVNKVIFKKKSL